MLAVDTPFRQFFDKVGLPLQAGYLYFGAVGQNPETNPVTVYWDAAGTQPAAQPVRTINGYASRNGSPAQVYASADYSLTVRDHHGRLVVSAANSADYSLANAVAALSDSTDAAKGDALIAVKQPFLNSSARTQHDYNSDRWSVLDAGSIGTADDTAVVQAAMTAAATAGKTLLFPKGTYTVLPITVPSNLTLVMEPGVVIKAKTGYGVNDRLLNLVDCSNVTIFGNGATIQMLKSEYVSGEQRHGVFMIGATDVRIYDLNSIDSGGDGFYIGRSGGAGTHCKRVKMQGCRAVNNRRQGLSIVSGEDVSVLQCAFESTDGTDPQYGIDIEPNDSLDELLNISLIDIRTKNNTGGGILFALRAFSFTAAKNMSVRVRGYVSDSDGNTDVGVFSGAIKFVGSGGGAWTNKIYGTIEVDDFIIVTPHGSGIHSNRWQADKAPLIRISNGDIINVGSGTSPNSPEDKSGIVIWSQDAGGANWGNIDIRSVRVHDTRGTAATYSAVIIYATAGGTGYGQASDIKLKDVIGTGFTPLSGRGHLSVTVDMDLSSVSYTDEQVITDGMDPANPYRTSCFAGYTLLQTSSGVIPLPQQSKNRGLAWTFRQTVDANNMQIRPNAADTIDFAIKQGNDLILSKNGGEVTLRMSAISGVVRAERFNPLANRPGTGQDANLNAPGREVWGVAAPTTGAWLRGDRVRHSSPSVGSPKGWICTVSGTPGTWVSEGNL